MVYYVFNRKKKRGCNSCGINYCIYNLFINKKHDIDHINGDHYDNRPINLQPLCKSCHATKTNNQTKKLRINSSYNQSISLIAYKKDDNNFKEEFTSSSDVEKKLQLTRGNVSTSARNFEKGIITWVGSKKHNDKYRFEKNIPLLENEIFKDIIDLPGQVSNKGRIKSYKDGRITYGFNNNNCRDLKVSINSNDYYVHIIVAKTWLNTELNEKAKEIKNNYKECINMSIEEIIKSNGMKKTI
jgi:hypothetical protein